MVIKYMKYAPLLITTMNRFDHLKRCLESLRSNSLAEHSPLIISVDYPPHDKYLEGYNRVCEYLGRGIKGFRNVEVIYQKYNLGLVDNLYYIYNHAKKMGYDRFIYIEDDIEVSANFIEFMNKGLEIIKNKQEVFAVCATRANQWPCIDQNDHNNVLLTSNFSGCAFGMFTKIMDTFRKTITETYLKKNVNNRFFRKKLLKESPELILSMQDVLIKKKGIYDRKKDDIPVIDVTIKVFLKKENGYVLSPYVSKVYNGGYDGSGYDCPNTGLKPDIRDKSQEFDIIIQNKLIKDKPMPDMSFGQWLRTLLACIKLSFIF